LATQAEIDAANAKADAISKAVGTTVDLVYPMTKVVHGGELAENTSAAPIGFRYDNGNAQYVNIDMGGNITGVTDRGHGLVNQLGNMINDMKPMILAVASGGAFGPEGILASKIINAGTAIQNGNVLGGLSQMAGIVNMPDTATALSVANALKNNDYASLALGAIKNTGVGAGIGSTEILPDLTVTGAVNLASAISGLGSKNPRTVISSIADLQDRAPDLFDSVTAAVTGGGGGGGLDTVADIADTVAGGPGDDFVTGGASNDSVTSGGGLDNVTVSGSNGVTGTDAIDTILGNLGTTRSISGNPTVLNEVTTTGTTACLPGQVRNPLTGKCEDITNILSGINVTGTPDVSNNVLDSVTTTGSCPPGQVRNPITKKCEDVSNILSGVTVTGTCLPTEHKDPVTGACVPNTGALDTVETTGTCLPTEHKDPVTGKCVPNTGALDTVETTGTCLPTEHKDPVTGKCVPNTGALDTVTVTGSCLPGYTKNPVTGACELDVLNVDELPPLPPVTKLCGINQHLDPVTNQCVDNVPLDPVVVSDSCSSLGEGYYKDPITGKCVKDEDPVECQPGYHPHPVTGECVQDNCPAGQTRDPVTGECKEIVIDTSCPTGQHRDTVTGECVPDTKPPVVVPPVVVPPPPPPPPTPTPTGALPTYTDPTGIPGKVLTLGKMGNLMRYDEGLKQLDVPTMQHWADMADMALPTSDVAKAQSALAQYAPDAEKDVIPQFYAHGGAVQHFAEGAQPDAAALSDAYARRDLMDAFKNLGNIGSGLEPLKPKVFQMGQMGAPSQQKQLQQMSVIPQLAALLQSRGMKLAEGGQPDHEHPEYDGNPVFRTGGLSGLGGKYVEGKGDGTSDDIAAMLANGEYVFSADVVSALGNGSNKAGAKELDQMVQAIRSRARSAPPDKLPPDAKSPLEYLKSSKGSKHG
jgi:hypothetical protein